MKISNKYLRSLKMDLWGNNFSQLKTPRALKSTKTELISVAKRKKFNRLSRSKFEFRKILNRLSRKEQKRQDKTLDFSSKNSRNSFLRTKRKSSYGQTLLEKRKVKVYVPFCTNSRFHKVFSRDKTRTLLTLNKDPYQMLNRLSVFDSKNVLLDLYKYRSSVEYDQISVAYDDSSKHLNRPRLFYRRRLQNNFPKVQGRVYTQPSPPNLLHDHRLNRIIFIDVIKNNLGNTFPFKFDTKKFNQHFLLNRN